MITLNLHTNMSPRELDLARRLIDMIDPERTSDDGHTREVGPAPVAVPPVPLLTRGDTPPAEYDNAVTVVTPPAGVPLDANGLPWDERIHAGTRGQNQDGTWKRRRNIDDATFNAVERELKRLMAIPAPTSTADETPEPSAAFAPPPPPAANVAPVAPAIATDANGEQELPAAFVRASAPVPSSPYPAPVPPATPPAPVAADDAVDTFPKLMTKLTPLISSQKLPMTKIVEACKMCGLTEGSLPALGARPDLVPAVWATIMAMVSDGE